MCSPAANQPQTSQPRPLTLIVTSSYGLHSLSPFAPCYHTAHRPGLQLCDFVFTDPHMGDLKTEITLYSLLSPKCLLTHAWHITGIPKNIC